MNQGHLLQKKSLFSYYKSNVQKNINKNDRNVTSNESRIASYPEKVGQGHNSPNNMYLSYYKTNFRQISLK